MRAYTVHAPPREPADPERFSFIKDGISWPALFVPVLWIFYHRLWLTLVWYIVFILVVAWIGRLVNDDVATFVAILGAILFALEANNIRRLSLIQRGWREVGGSYGKNLVEAEARFFGAWGGSSAGRDLPTDPKAVIARAAYPDDDRVAHDGPIFGLFPEPER
jgi:hypothetical protein